MPIYNNTEGSQVNALKPVANPWGSRLVITAGNYGLITAGKLLVATVAGNLREYQIIW